MVNEFTRGHPSWAPPPLSLLPCRTAEKHLTLEGVEWPTDETDRKRAFVYITRQVIHKGAPRPRPASHLTTKQVQTALPSSDAELNLAFPYAPTCLRIARGRFSSCWECGDKMGRGNA